MINPRKNPILNPDKTVKKIVNKADKLSEKMTINGIIKTAIDCKTFMKTLKNAFDNVSGTGINLTDNEIKNILKVLRK